ncbi:prolyl 4-hydroxylase subunit alpha-1-like protein [Trifolium pratense]|uniref:Prolyl 4-hydroxylase subunit alpha-1-like protein n=1 Tax=Trifolium pratense TaxID=57577 RepID=A0A2K3NRW0_TRIPR|nr:prolyl 4-hydroxylase subunit alpha-1-like protein [Trifolium pratense]
MKTKTVKGNWSFRTNKLTFPYVFLICIFFFLAGFFGSTLFSHSQDGDGYGLRPRPRSRLLESRKEGKYNLMTAGEFGDDSITSIPFQVLSWKPRALYFPNFATAEQCESIVSVAKAGLKPSSLALRKGETAENTKGIRTSSGVFISASEDNTGTLDVIEEKIARATMIPRSHGENIKTDEIIEPGIVLASRKIVKAGGKERQYLVHWKSLIVGDATCDDKLHLCSHFPNFIPGVGSSGVLDIKPHVMGSSGSGKSIHLREEGGLGEN